MGVCHSEFDDRFERAATDLGPFLEKLGMPDAEAKRFYRVFEKVDSDLEGGISLDEFFDYFDLEFSSFAQRAFSIMDVDKSGGGKNSLDFGEFLAGVYNYCTMKHAVLVKFAFDLFDHDNSGSIDRKEIKDLILMIYGKKKLDENLEKFLNRYDKDRGGSIDLNEWRESEKRNRTMLFPAFELQKQMRDCVLGESYWLKATRSRSTRLRELDILDLYYKCRTGKTLNRNDEYENASYRKDGAIRSEIADEIDVMDSPRDDASVVRTLVRNDNVHIYGEREDATDATILWYLINDKEAQWIKADVVKLDASWAKHERELKMRQKKKAEEQAKNIKTRESEEVKKESLKDVYEEHVDEDSGMKYWYNNETGEATWVDPFK